MLLKQSYTVDAITPEGLPTTKRVEIGKYKSQPVHVLTKTGEIFRFATPEETPILMGELIDWYREKTSNDNVNPILLAAEFHYKFIRIHPFDDGNGRTARILMNFILMKYNFPPVIIKTEEKNQYFTALQLADSGMIEAFVNYIAMNFVHSLEIMIRGAKGESIEDPDDLDKELAILELRLNGGNQEIEKTLDLVINLYDKSVVPIFNKYFLGCEKFDRFYVRSGHFIASYNHTSSNLSVAIPKIKNSITLKTFSFRTSAFYENFRHSEYGDFNFYSSLEIILNNNTYIIRNEAQTINIEKKYTEQLSEKEIDNLIGFELKRHRDYIEEKTKTV